MSNQNMASVNNYEILDLIHGCLTEFHLLKSARCLQEESGQDFSSTDVSLQHIIETYNCMSRLLSQFPNVAEVKDKKIKTDTKSSKSKNTVTKVEAQTLVTQENKKKPKNKRTKKSDTDEAEKTVNDDVKETEVRPKKRGPLVPPGTWVAPEMEATLGHIYDELKQLEGSATNMFSHLSSIKKKNEPENALKSKIGEEDAKSDINYSESEDSSENVLVKLSNGIVFNVPSVKGNLNKRKAKSPEKEKEIPKKKKKKEKSEEDTKDIVDIAEEENEIHVSSKKKKKHKDKGDDEKKQNNIPDRIRDNTSQDEEVSVEENSIDKKKKKKKKKKEHKKENIEEDEENDNDHERPQEKKKKKKKKKEKAKEKETDTDTEEDTNRAKTEESDSQEDFQSLRKKKSKEKTPFRRVKDDEVIVHQRLADNSYEAKCVYFDGVMYCHPLNIIPRRKSNISIRDDIAKIYNLHSYQKTCQLIDVLPARHTPDLRRTSTTDESSQENSAGILSCGWFRNLKAKKWFKPLLKTILFLLHFSVVFAVLGIGAMFLADIEDPAPSDKQIFDTKFSNETNNTVMIKNSDDLFWEHLKDEFGVAVTTEQRESFMKEITRRVHEQELEIEQRLRNEERKDRTFIFWKWVYFTTVACTTIGYGDVVPETNNGRFFYMIFSLFGIPLMVSLLKACGKLINSVNKRFFRFINSCCFKGDPWVSEDLMTIFSILLLFVGYVAVGCVFNAAINGRPLFDSIYYWIVTFSTVGFGDLVQPLEDQVNWAFPLMIYRIFGLAMLAGVIDAILDYMDYRKEYIQKKRKMIIRKSSERIASFRFDSKRKFKTPPPRPPSVAAEKMKTPKIADATETENLPELVNENRHSNIFSHLADDVDRKNSFHETRTSDDRINESVFGRMYDESGVESDINDDYFIGDIDSQASDQNASYA